MPPRSNSAVAVVVVVLCALGLLALYAAVPQGTGSGSANSRSGVGVGLVPLLGFGGRLAVDLRWQDLRRHAAMGKPAPGRMHVLVTGAAGFIGSHAILRLLEEGYMVTGVDNFSRGNRGAVSVLQAEAPEGRFHFVEMDLGVAEDVEALVSAGGYDAILHFAAVAYVGESVAEPLRYYSNVTVNTLLMVAAAERHGISRFVYSSTCAVYGSPEIVPIVESTPLRPVSPYGQSKLAAESAVADVANRPGATLGAAVLRYFNVIGADPKGRLGEAPPPALARIHGRISNACFDAALGLRPHLELFGTDFPTPDGTCVRDYIHVMDLVDAHLAVLDKIKVGKVLRFNVAVGHGYSVREFTEACRRVTGKNIIVKERARRPGDAAEVYADSAYIQKTLGWKAKFANLDDALAPAWAWQQQHPNGYDNPPRTT